MNLRHITRFTYEFTNFQGWRVAISRQGTTLARYFSDKQFGSPEQAMDRAIAFRDMVLDELHREPEKTRDILYKYRICARKTDSATAPLLPQTPELQPDSSAASVSTLHMVENLRKLFQFLQLDTPGVLKLALYMLTLDTATAMPLAKPLSTAIHADAKTAHRPAGKRCHPAATITCRDDRRCSAAAGPGRRNKSQRIRQWSA